MGKDFPLAWEEEEGQSMLLARTSSGECITTAYNGDKRKEESISSRGYEERKAKDIETKSKSSIKAKRVNARSSTQDRCRRGNQDRKSYRGDEGEDYEVGRSAQDLGIVHPGSYCDELETVPHYWIEKETVDKGSLFQCKLCYDYLWLPSGWSNEDILTNLIQKYGKNEGYCRLLNRHRQAKILMAKMQDLRRLDTGINDARKFAKMVDKILSKKEYDKEVK